MPDISLDYFVVLTGSCSPSAGPAHRRRWRCIVGHTSRRRRGCYPDAGLRPDEGYVVVVRMRRIVLVVVRMNEGVL